MPETTQTAQKPPRIQSLDIFRGLNIALMIFVNELDEVRGLPWWTHHAKASVNVMTYVDMVFPGFLIIVGMSLPLALNARIRRGDKAPQLVWYIVLRSAALIVLGLILENGQYANAALMHGLGKYAWSLLALFSAFLIWMDYPRTDSGDRQILYRGMRFTGLLLLALLVVVYRRTIPETGATAWLTFDYPEILGIIGYSYFLVGLCYLATRRWLWAPVVWFLAFLTMNIFSSAGKLNTHYPWWILPARNGSSTALIFAGIILSTIFFLEPRCNTFARKAVPAIAFGIVSAVAAWLLQPLGISKIRATPTWVLYDVAACCAIYCLLYFICDVKKHVAWAAPVRSAGSNTLLTYLLPDVVYYVLGALGITWWSRHFAYGAPGVARTIIFTLVMLAFSTLLTRLRLRLQI